MATTSFFTPSVAAICSFAFVVSEALSDTSIFRFPDAAALSPSLISIFPTAAELMSVTSAAFTKAPLKCTFVCGIVKVNVDFLSCGTRVFPLRDTLSS